MPSLDLNAICRNSASCKSCMHVTLWICGRVHSGVNALSYRHYDDSLGPRAAEALQRLS